VDLNHIVGDQTVTTLDQLQSSLTLTDATLAHDQDTFTIDIHQNTMDRNTWCQFHAKPADNFCHQVRCDAMAGKQRLVIFLRQLDHILIRFCPGGIDHTRNIAG